MEHAARRHNLREQLGRAREALDRGEPDEALAAVDRALQIDPDYLAAQALRERILRRSLTGTGSGPLPAMAAHGATAAPAPVERAGTVSAGVLRFEARIRGRRIEKRAEAARAALAAGRPSQARAAIAEIAEIDTQHPEHALLLTELAAHTSRVRRWPRFGLAVAALAVCGASILVVRSAERPRVGAQPPAGPQLQGPAIDLADTVVPTAAPVVADAESGADVGDTPQPSPASVPQPAPASTASPRLPVSTSGRPTASPFPATPGANRPGLAAPVGVEPAAVDRPDPSPLIAPIEPTDPAQLPGALTAPQQDARVRPVERATDAVSGPRPTGGAPVTPPVRDEDLVLRALQQYRRAYDMLDARAAQAVWPGVDGVALQRAFDGLVSQRLTFRSCQLQMNGASATAACLGTARYTPRVGSREARDEPRDWRFTLRKTANDDWQIESALVAR